MKCEFFKTASLFLFAMSVMLILFAGTSFGHCDGMDGPVVKAAQRALESGNVNLVLIWVQPSNEAEIKKAFEGALSDRKKNPEAREKADLRFFETLVRIHRTGEGEPYTGLKPAGRDLGPMIPAADRAIEEDSVDSLLRLLPPNSYGRVRRLFQDVVNKKNYNPDDVGAGREYVKAYVIFLHETERIYDEIHGQSKEH